MKPCIHFACTMNQTSKLIYNGSVIVISIMNVAVGICYLSASKRYQKSVITVNSDFFLSDFLTARALIFAFIFQFLPHTILIFYVAIANDTPLTNYGSYSRTLLCADCFCASIVNLWLKSQMSAPSPNTPGMPNLKQQDGKSPALKVTGNGKPTNNNNVKAGTPGQSLRAEGGGGTMEENVGGGETKGNNNNNNQGGEQKIDIKDGSKKPSGGKGGGGAAAVAIGGGGIPVTTAKDSGRHQEKHRDVDDTQRSHQSTKKKKKASAEHPKEKKSKSDKLKNGVALFAPEMDVGSDEETLQNVKSLEKENEHSLQNDAK
uniref:Uncharacterized protein n=1 Tax=Panagrolaimus sp. ES5 TaxID=591445 RepID=A0AC34FRS7_9BILA